MDDRTTLLRPPPPDPSKAPIENVLEVTELAVLGPDIFTNARKPWHPPGARGIYGGAVIAMCLAAGQRTVPDDFNVHSLHAYFLLAGSGQLPILFHVERVRDGRSFATRTVQARQKGRCIFTTTISFVREGSSGKPGSQASHSSPMPRGGGGDDDDDGQQPLRPPPDDFDGEPELIKQGPFQSDRIEIVNRDSAHAHEKKTRQWFRARGRIAGGPPAHLAALAYVSDSYFIGTVSRIHRLWRFPFNAKEYDDLPADVKTKVRTLHEWEGLGSDPRDMVGQPVVGMMVSLDHSIYFHEPGKVRADEWMLNEMESPWAGDGRGVVTQKIFSKDGTLIATCVQEGIIRLKEEAKLEEGKGSKL
ncbi:thioesterase-like superfamily-domain-containing protein [Lasiosphaeria miniovina]|uniref:Thioesterase-like superfamily-domain-containing protein n=1 Tax=Lasiosphaeria miniovina TaxID=1954250 RepID=A0AA39ZST7_9PEZI|nr:thioesterase-like superfamily-domain-containing protein [Lasiosphaeria miniovina]KAK0703036.1 thioesterase-like superfamily-domain-containing protein [Lasiosphaeria miniovina]